MITFITSAKPFRDTAAIHQRNAIASWLRLDPAPEVLLFGDDEGSAGIAAEFGLRHEPAIARNRYGTPLLSDIFERGQALATRPLCCYVNADIILQPDFAAAAARLARWRERFVMVGHRWDVDLDAPLDYAGEWRAVLERVCREHGARSDSSALDYFLFPRGTIAGMPPFAIGRPVWDNWLVCHLVRGDIALVDATAAVRAVHPRHGYAHVRQRTGSAWEGPEADLNRALARLTMPRFMSHCYTIRSARWVLDRQGPRPALSPAHLRWRLHEWYWCSARARGLRAAAVPARRFVRAFGSVGPPRLWSLLVRGVRFVPILAHAARRRPRQTLQRLRAPDRLRKLLRLSLRLHRLGSAAGATAGREPT